jgi:TetR/AcrR family transcriptional regulator, mexCD-oprJ operon repressor
MPQTGKPLSRMSEPRPRDALQERVLQTLLDGAARAIARRGEAASMSEIAAEAGVARATVYRYFGSRGALESAVAERGVARARQALRAGRIEEVPVGEGVRRAVRALHDVGEVLVVMLRRRGDSSLSRFDADVAGPLRRVLHAGQEAGAIRDDVPAAWLAESLIGLVAHAVAMPPAAGKEDTLASIAGLFLDGAGTAAIERRTGRPRPTRAGDDHE